ncbi:MAG: hypothetical protein IT435_02405 [Phycisphaerales bacterium]|nr:hypothetical protein [Phycisphaerales bacterium]
MAYQTGTATSQEDLMGALNTFAVAQGWTSDIYSTTDDWLALNNGSVYVQFRWDNSSGIAMFHSTGFINTSTAPGNHTNDDGCGTVDASAPYNSTISTGRRITVGNGPYTAYHFFTDGTTQYIHVALEYSPGLYRHFSFGTIDKIGTWTGGQYAVAHRYNSSSLGTVNSSDHSILWSGSHGGSTTAEANESGSLRVEGFSNQTGSMRWLLFTTQTASLGNDRGSNARISCPGGFIDNNPWLANYGLYRANLLNGFLPLIPIPIFWRDTTPAPDQYMLLGFAPDVYHIQMANLAAGQEFTIGADTFKVFPIVRKQNTSSSVEESKNAGVVYRKVP